MNETKIPEAVERALQQFEAMAAAENWALDKYGNIRVDETATWPRCPLVWMAGFPKWGELYTTARAAQQLGLGTVESEIIYSAADSADSGAPDVRARLLDACGL